MAVNVLHQLRPGAKSRKDRARVYVHAGQLSRCIEDCRCAGWTLTEFARERNDPELEQLALGLRTVATCLIYRFDDLIRALNREDG